MNKHTLRVLEFNSILSLLKGFATSSLGEALCESLKPKRDIKEIEVLLNEVSELKEVLQIYDDIPISGIRDIEKPVTKTRVEGAIMDPIELLDILSTLKATHKLKRFFGKLEDNRYPLLLSLQNACPPSQQDRQGYRDREEPPNLSKGVVPIDIHFDKDCNTLIITGANTGGKTVALKKRGSDSKGTRGFR